MRKITLTLLLVLSFAGAVKAQVSFGAKAGMNYPVAMVYGNAEDFEAEIGYSAGLFVGIGLSESITFEPELLFSKLSTNVTSIGADLENVTKNMQLNYLNIPLKFKFKIIGDLGIEVDPEIGLLLSAKEEFVDMIDVKDMDIKEQLKTVDFDLNFGLSYDFSDEFFMDARYNLGFMNISQSNELEDKIKNSVIAFSLGYKFI